MGKEDECESTYQIPCKYTVTCVEFSPFDWSCQLLAVGTASGVTVYSCKFQEEDASITKGIDITHVRDFPTTCNILAIAWSPQTSLTILPKVLSFAVATDDWSLSIYSTDMNTVNTVKVCSGHKGFINSLTFDPNEGELLASTGDDMTCRVWSAKEASEQTVFHLTSPGMSVCWRQEELYKLLVAQKDGTIRMFSLHNQTSILSLTCGQSPLMAADWSPHDNTLVAAVAGSDWMLFNLAQTSLPVAKGQAHTEGCRQVRWSRCHEALFATTGRPGTQLKVFNTRHQQLHVNTSLKVSHGLTWHLHLPIVAVGGDKRVHLWTVEAI